MRKSVCWVGLVSLTLIGCGPSNTPITADQTKHQTLDEVGELYRLFSIDKKKPPTSIDDFDSLRSIAPKGFAALKSGDIIIFFGGSMTALEEGPPSGTSEEVLAYEKQVPESSGEVLMMDRSIKKMTAEEFKSAKKAGKPI